jgi:hypothetical protein
MIRLDDAVRFIEQILGDTFIGSPHYRSAGRLKRQPFVDLGFSVRRERDGTHGAGNCQHGYECFTHLEFSYSPSTEQGRFHYPPATWLVNCNLEAVTNRRRRKECWLIPSMPQFKSKLPLELRSEVGTARQLPLLQTGFVGLNRKDSPVTMLGQMTTYRYLRGQANYLLER